MKKLLILAMFVMTSIFAMGQKDITKFLGIPIDGFKSEMKQKLIEKGYTYQKVEGNEYFEGEFNGMDVHLILATNNNKVWRIVVADQYMADEANIKIRFNNLVAQFKNNKRYTCDRDYTISEDEDISYGMNIKNKTYDAIFYQNVDLNLVDTLALQQEVRNKLLAKYSEEILQNPTEEIKQECVDMCMKYYNDLLYKKPVWIRIQQLYGKYYLSIFYDNEYNRANGDDL